MKMSSVFVVLFAVAGCVSAQTQLTIYNRNFATVKESRSFDLRKGENEIRATDITAHLEPESVILRDLQNPDAIRILEQNYESDPLSEGLLLYKSEGKVLDFETTDEEDKKTIVKGKVLRSGYVRRMPGEYDRQYEAIVEVGNKVQFGLPGRPIFEALDPTMFLKPTLLWLLWTDKAGKHDVEFSYLTGGMRWEANYNCVAPEKGDVFDIIGWITLENVSGRDFANASVKLMAGDVARAREAGRLTLGVAEAADPFAAAPAPVTERSFDEYHLYTLPRPTTLRDREVKQVEFVRAANVPGKRVYVYDGFGPGSRYDGSFLCQDQAFGAGCSRKVRVLIEFKNSEQSYLGLPLPKGKVKIYRRDVDGRNEFTGEDVIDHTPKDETIRIYTGNAFDLVGERKQTSFKRDTEKDRWIEEKFEIRVRNRKAEDRKEDVEVRVVEHMYRWANWTISDSSTKYEKTDAMTVEFRPTIKAGGEAVITYTVRYSW